MKQLKKISYKVVVLGTILLKLKLKENLSIISPKHSFKDLCKIKRNLKKEILVCFIKEFNYTSVALKNRAHCILSIQCTIFRI